MSNSKFVLSSEQQAVVYSKEPKFTVKAAAGSGKTRVLVEKYLRHVIEDNIQPDQILTVTFTKKAAAEMKKRIVEALIQNQLFEEAQIAETGPIQTIHSFCERTLRENAISAGIDPEFSILSESQFNEIFDRSLQNCLSRLENLTEPAQQLVKKLVGKMEYQQAKELHTKLANSIRTVLHTFRGSGKTRCELAKIYHSVGSLVQAFQDTVSKEFGYKPSNQNNSSWCLDFHQFIRNHHLKTPKWFKEELTASDQNDYLLTCGLMQLTLETWASIDHEIDEIQSFDFSLLESKTLDLLTQNSLANKKIQSKYKIILIDESQDINPVQYRLIEALNIEHEMMVGDPQQSIYSFRQADRKLFVEKTQNHHCKDLSTNYRSEPGILNFIDTIFEKLWQEFYNPMSKRKKDSPAAKDCDLFGSISPGTDIDFKGVELWLQKKKDQSLTTQWIKQLIDEGEKPGDIAVLVRTSFHAAEISQQLNFLKIPNRISGGAEKYFTRLEIRDLANALEALDNPYDDFALLALLYSPIVNLSLDSIILLAKQAPVWEALQQYQPELPDDKEHLSRFLQWFLPLCPYANRLPAWEAISEIFCRSPYLEQLAIRPRSEQTLANVRKLLCLAAEEPELSPKKFAQRIRNIQKIHHREGDAPSLDEDTHTLSIMTIHKSKGLEFPIVVLPDMHQRLNRATKDIVCLPEQSLLATRFEETATPLYKYLEEKRKQQEQEEELRILYVAMTRAQRKLCVCVHPEGQSDTLAGLLSKTLDLKRGVHNSLLIRQS
jgi:ATP-dependent helicase/nuclease subunit A